jgi:hypothetical protein
LILLADLLEENAELHAAYGPAGAGARDAPRHLAALGARTKDAGMATACEDLAAAIEFSRGALEAADADALAREVAHAQSAMGQPSTSRRERDALLVRLQLLRHRMATLASSPGIPRVVHLVRTDASSDDLPLLQFLCYRSVLAHCAGWRVMLHTPSVPQGARWSRLLPHLDVHVARTPQWLGDRRLVAAAHQSDVWRVRQLIDHGGFYFDWDLLLLRAPEPLRAHVCVMALERKEEDHDEVLGVSAIGAEPGSAFLQRWLDEMPGVFNPRKYTAHSVALGHRLARELPALVRVLDYRSFYDPGWGEASMKFLFDPGERLDDPALRDRFSAAFGMHLFCSHANFVRRAPGLTERVIESAQCNLAALLRPYL